MKKLITHIAIFWVLAFAYSYLLNIYIPKELAQAIYPGLNVFSYGLGPALAVGTMGLFGKIKTYSLSGYTQKNWILSLLIFFTPIAVVCLTNPNQLPKAFLIVLSIMLYCIGEEIGWRGWLLKQLEDFGVNQVIQTLVIWVLWLVWHLSFQTINLTFALLLLLGVIGINLATRKTGSILVASAMHAVINLASFFPSSLFFVIPIWVAIFVWWERLIKSENNSQKREINNFKLKL
jgi:membrane protease YdiL (CAAX protease family)